MKKKVIEDQVYISFYFCKNTNRKETKEWEGRTEGREIKGEERARLYSKEEK